MKRLLVFILVYISSASFAQDYEKEFHFRLEDKILYTVSSQNKMKGYEISQSLIEYKFSDPDKAIRNFNENTVDYKIKNFIDEINAEIEEYVKGKFISKRPDLLSKYVLGPENFLVFLEFSVEEVYPNPRRVMKLSTIHVENKSLKDSKTSNSMRMPNVVESLSSLKPEFLEKIQSRIDQEESTIILTQLMEEGLSSNDTKKVVDSGRDDDQSAKQEEFLDFKKVASTVISEAKN